jgi:asparagine synthase (glutamine-hydrolysing)
MCGIAAVLGDPAVIGFDVIAARLLVGLRHRGPDHEETWLGEVGPGRALCLLHTRLAILDLSPAGQQPMTDPETGNVIVFNGEIYNFAELRSELRKRDTNYQFRSTSDTEVLLRGYAAWGTEMLKRLDGMFAFVLYDRRRGTLLVARDHIGIKPLYYVELRNGGLAFASEIRALMGAGLCSRQIDPIGMASFLRTGAVEEPATICRGVFAFPPGAWSEISLKAPGRPVPIGYWRPECFLTGRSEGNDHAALLKATVREQLVADVPVGLFLSAGIDSTVLAAIASSIAPGDLQAFTIRSGEGTDDEADLAAATASRLGVRHMIEPLAAARAEAWVLDGVAAMDQPSSDGINSYLISRVSREKGMTAVLAGTGADELHGGYPHFASLPRWRNPVMGFFADAALIPGLRLAKQATAAERFELIRAAGPSIGAMLAEKRRYFTPSWIAKYAPHWSDVGGQYVPSMNEPVGARDAIMIGELSGYLRNMLLRDSDWATMANAQELRVPYLGRRYMEFVLGLPWSEKARRGNGPNKPLLSREIPGNLHEVARRPKTGFELDYPGMLSGPHSGFFRAAILSLNAVGFVLEGDRMLEALARTRSHKESRRLWSLMCLGAYVQKHRLSL